ncbi:MAG: hypothetical protein ACJ8AH_15950 [Stellaceae bacterium]
MVKPIALIGVIGFLALFGYACAPTPRGSALKVEQVCNDGVLAPVPFLKVPFYPMEPYEQDPEADPVPVNLDIQADLAAAFQAAPPFFKAQLCNLRGIYINPTGCGGYDPGTCGNLSDTDVADNSWGFRNTEKAGYIAISLGLWKNNPCKDAKKVCAPTLRTYETKRLLALLNRTAEKDLGTLSTGDRKPHVTIPSYEVSPDIPSVLAALAHELGHVLWWQVFVPQTRSQYLDTATFCDGGFYPSGAWQGTPVDIPKHRWIGFGDIRLQPKDSDVQLLAQFLQSGDYSRAFDRLHRIYSNGRWASALAAFSPDEDFVETFELFVLLNAGLRQAAITTYGHRKYSDSIVRDVNVAPFLQTKLQCFARLAQPASR